LTTFENSLLSKGFSFAVCNKKLSIYEHEEMVLTIENSISSIASRLNQQQDCKFDKTYFDRACCKLASTKPTKTFPNDFFAALMCKHLSQRLKIVSKQITTYAHKDNLSQPERIALTQFKKRCNSNGDLIIRKADKSQQLVLLNRNEYVEAVEKILSDCNTYEKIEFNRNRYTAACIIRIVKNSPVLTSEQKEKLLTFTGNPKDRQFYCLPKS
jgi:hypothetical protein